MGRRRKDFVGPIPEKEISKKAKKEINLEDADFPIQKQFLHKIKTNTSIDGTLDIVAVMAKLFVPAGAFFQDN